MPITRPAPKKPSAEVMEVNSITSPLIDSKQWPNKASIKKIQVDFNMNVAIQGEKDLDLIHENVFKIFNEAITSGNLFFGSMAVMQSANLEISVDGVKKIPNGFPSES